MQARDQLIVKSEGTAKKLAHHIYERPMTWERRVGERPPKGTVPPKHIIHPTSPHRIAWDLVSILFLVWTAFVMPYTLGFGVNTDEPGFFHVMDILVDTFFCVDLILNFFTGFMASDIDGEEFVQLNPNLIILNYLRTWFFIDLVSSVPLNHVIKSFPPQLQTMKLLKFGKLLKVTKLLRFNKLLKLGANGEFQDRIEEAMYSSSIRITVELFSLLVGWFALCHLLACGAFHIASTNEPGWLTHYRDGDDAPEDDRHYPTSDRWPLHRQYLLALYWAMTTVTTVSRVKAR
jgi:hypothetical protein